MDESDEVKTGEAAAATDWDAIRDAYLYGTATVAQICADHAISHPLLYRRIAREGWPKRIDRQRTGRARVARGNGDHERLVRRLYRQFERHMRALDGADGAEGETPLAPTLAPTLAPGDADGEKRARTLATLARTLEKLIELEGGIDAREAAREAESDDHDTERLRAELARRIANLARSAKPGRGSEGPETA